jgi:hypothetical protein
MGCGHGKGESMCILWAYCIGMESISVVSAHRRNGPMEQSLFSLAFLFVQLLLRWVEFCVFKVRIRRDIR